MSSYPSPTDYPAQASEPPLDRPYYGATFSAAIRRFFSKYATFSGRASRSEYWWYALFALIVGLALAIVDSAITGGSDTMVFGGLWSLATLVPGLAILWRRLHDSGRSGAWFFIAFIPVVGAILLLVWTISGPRPEGARFDR